MKKPLVSIIVTAFNVQEYILECLDSIKKQSYRNIEVIIIDDGSSDMTLELCEEFRQKDSRFYIIHQENHGKVSARNLGLRYAKGEYIGFVDGDDWLEPEQYEYLVECLLEKNADLVTSGYIKSWKNVSRIITDPFEERLYNSYEDLEYIISNFLFDRKGLHRGMIKSQCCKLYKRNILLRIIDKIPLQLKYNEDCLLNMLYILESKSIYIGKKAYYHYRIYGESAVGRKCEDYLIQINMFFLEIKKIFQIIKPNKSIVMQLDKMIAIQTIVGLNYKLGLSGTIYIPWYEFNIDELNGKKIILYGAGEVGRDYYFQIKRQNNLKLVLWVDNDYQRLRDQIIDLKDICEISKVEYDRVLIAVKSRDLAEEISKKLIGQYGIIKEKIIWKEPRELYFVND